MKGNRLRILLVVLLLMAANVACVSEEQMQRWVDQLVQDMTQAIEQWAREQVDRLVEDIKQEIQEALKQFLTELRNSIWPPAPTITAPPDGTTVAELSVTIQGEGVAGTEVSLYRDDRFFRKGQVDSRGQWRMEHVALHAGRSTAFTAKITSGLLPSRASNRVVVTSTGSEPGIALPRVIPELPGDLDRHAWMLHLAMTAIEEGGNTFYTAQRKVYLVALEAGLRAAAQDRTVHRYIDPRLDLRFDRQLLAFAIPEGLSRDDAIRLMVRVVKSMVFDRGVQETLIKHIHETYTDIDVHRTLTDGGQTLSVRLIYVSFDRKDIISHFTASRWAILRQALRKELLSTVAGSVSESLIEKATQLSFALFGLAAGDREAQKYYDLALAAWHNDERWADWNKNGLDQVEGVHFDTNEEWAMFYLGRVIFHLQVLADPYYTIPPYKGGEDLFGDLAKAYVKKWARDKLAERGVVVIGGGAGLAPFLTALEVFDVFDTIASFFDAGWVNDVHRPNFEKFVGGQLYDVPIPDSYRRGGATNARAGLPFRGPTDILLHGYLRQVSPQVWERGERPQELRLTQLLDDDGREFFIIHRYSDIQRVGRDLGQRAAQFVQPGGFAQTSMRIPEGQMILDTPFLIREVYAARLLNGESEALWLASEGQQVQVTLINGLNIRGRVVFNTDQPIAIEYLDPTTTIRLKHMVPTRYMVLEEVQCTAGPCHDFDARSVELYSLDHVPGHLYAVFDPAGAEPPALGGAFRKDLAGVLVGLDGWSGPPPDHPYPEKNGAATIAYHSLFYGTLGTMKALNAFADASSEPSPEPIIVGPDDLAVTLGSPAKLHLYDAQGHHVGPNAAGGVDLEIPGARYSQTTSPEQTIIFVSNAGPATNYHVEVEGTETGEVDIETFVGDRRSSTVSHQAYLGISVTPNTRAELDLHPTGPAPLALDADGDGIFEAQRDPAERDVLQVYEARKSVLDAILTIVQTRPELLAAAGGSVLTLLVGGILWHRRHHRGGPPAPPGVRRCPRCGTPAARPTSRFCGRCGARLP